MGTQSPSLNPTHHATAPSLLPLPPKILKKLFLFPNLAFFSAQPPFSAHPPFPSGIFGNTEDDDGGGLAPLLTGTLWLPFHAAAPE